MTNSNRKACNTVVATIRNENSLAIWVTPNFGRVRNSVVIQRDSADSIKHLERATRFVNAVGGTRVVLFVGSEKHASIGVKGNVARAELRPGPVAVREVALSMRATESWLCCRSRGWWHKRVPCCREPTCCLIKLKLKDTVARLDGIVGIVAFARPGRDTGHPAVGVCHGVNLDGVAAMVGLDSLDRWRKHNAISCTVHTHHTRCVERGKDELTSAIHADVARARRPFPFRAVPVSLADVRVRYALQLRKASIARIHAKGHELVGTHGTHVHTREGWVVAQPHLLQRATSRRAAESQQEI